MFAESEAEKAEWMKALKDTVEKKKAGVDFDKKEDKVGLDDFDLLKVIGKVCIYIFLLLLSEKNSNNNNNNVIFCCCIGFVR